MSYLSDLLGNAYKEGMTEEEISTALQNVGQSNETEVNRLKAALSKANSEAADYKKQLRSKQTDDEATAAAQKEEHDRLVQENTALKRSAALSDRKSKLIAMGYEETLASETATAMVDGDMDTVMANQSKYLEAQKQIILADKMRSTPRPAQGSDGAGEGMTLEKLRKMSSKERFQWANENPDDYKELYSEENTGGNE